MHVQERVERLGNRLGQADAAVLRRTGLTEEVAAAVKAVLSGEDGERGAANGGHDGGDDRDDRVCGGPLDGRYEAGPQS